MKNILVLVFISTFLAFCSQSKNAEQTAAEGADDMTEHAGDMAEHAGDMAEDGGDMAMMAMPEPVTFEGKLIDTKCYGMNHENHNNDHMVPMADGSMGTMPNCATACAQMGIPVGLLVGGEPGSDVKMLITPAGALANHQAKQARVTGTAAYPGGIIPMTIEVKEGDEWVDVTPAGMM